MKPYDLYYLIVSFSINFPMVWVHCYFLSLFEPEPAPARLRLILYGVMGCLNTFWFLYSRTIFFYAFTILLYAAYGLCARYLFHYGWKESIFYTILFYFLTHFVVRSACWASIRLLGYNFMSYGAELLPGVTGCLLIGAVSLLIIRAFRGRLLTLKGYRLSNREFLNIMLLSVPLIYFCHSQYLMTVDYLHLPPEMLLMRVAVSLSAVYALVGMVSLNRSKEEQLEKARMEALLSSQYEQFKLKKESSEVIMAKCHDLQKQLRLFETTNQPEYIEQYRQELQKTIADYDSLYETGNATIDTLLSEAGLKCRKDGVQIICLLDGRSFAHISPMDLCTIFGNALDNAIESSCRIAAREKRIIRVKSSEEKGMVVLRFENYYEHVLHWEEGELKTSKGEGSGHGYGLKSIRFAVQRYGGHVVSRAEDGRFVLTISLPAPEKASSY